LIRIRINRAEDYAKEVFDLIVKQAHKNGEPELFLLTALISIIPPEIRKIESTNPAANSLCCLMSLAI